ADAPTTPAVDAGNNGKRERTGFLRNLQQNARNVGVDESETGQSETGGNEPKPEQPKRRGRPKLPRDEHGNIIRNRDESGTAGTPNPGVNGSGGTESGEPKRSGQGRNRKPAGKPEEAVSVEQETVTVEEPPEPPKPRPTRRSPRKK